MNVPFSIEMLSSCCQVASKLVLPWRGLISSAQARVPYVQPLMKQGTQLHQTCWLNYEVWQLNL